MEHINGAGPNAICRGVPRKRGNSYITTFTAGVLCSEHENPVLHKAIGRGDFSRCKMQLYKGSRMIDESRWFDNCLADFDERDGGRFWLPNRKNVGLHQSVTYLPQAVDSQCRDRNNPCTLQFKREFKQNGRSRGVFETYTDCFDFVYDGAKANLQRGMGFRMQVGKDDKVCNKLGNKCKAGGRRRAPARRPPPRRSNPNPPARRRNNQG